MENLLRHYLEQGFLRSEVPGPTKPLPIVTLSREYGCPSKLIGMMLTDALNHRKKADDPNKWQFINKEVLETAARELNLPAVQVASMLSAEQKGVVYDILTFSSTYGGSQRIKKTLRNVILAMAARGNIVLVGRAGVAITRHLPMSLHIRLMAPLDWRSAELAKSKEITEKEALKIAADIDEKRTHLIESFLGSPMKPTLFDAIFNCRTLTREEIVGAIIRLMEAKKMI